MVQHGVDAEPADVVHLRRTTRGRDDAGRAVRAGEFGQASADARLLAHILLGAFHNDQVVRLMRTGESDRVARTFRELADALLAGPRDAGERQPAPVTGRA